MTKVINDTFGIEQALMSTIHAATAKQKAVDSRAGRGLAHRAGPS
jgi:glyceraldehyde 3-phosphate dehydrogenase